MKRLVSITKAAVYAAHGQGGFEGFGEGRGLALFLQEFEMPDVLALWDGFIADTGRPLPLLYYVCVAIIIWVG